MNKNEQSSSSLSSSHSNSSVTTADTNCSSSTLDENCSTSLSNNRLNSNVLIIKQKKIRNINSNKLTNCCIILDYVKTLKLLFFIFFLLTIFILSLFIFIVSVLTVNYCKSVVVVITNTQLYLIVFAIAVILRLFFYVSCPFSYEKFYKCCNMQNFKSIFTCCCCCVKTRIEFKHVSKEKKQSKLNYFSTKPLLELNIKFQETALRNEKLKTFVVHNHHHHRSNFYPHYERKKQKYKFINCDSIRYGMAICIQRAIDFFILIWFIYGNYAVFSVIGKQYELVSIMNSTENVTIAAKQKQKPYIFAFAQNKHEFCLKFSSYKIALIQIIATYTLFAFLIVLYVFYSASKLFYKFLKRSLTKDSCKNIDI